MISISSIPSHSPSVVSKKIRGEYLLVPLASNIADMDSLYKLNETGAFIWDSIDGHRTVSEIISLVTEEFETEAGEAEKDTIDFLISVEKFIQL